ncbi:MAG TPA: urea amidolyase associated protein UAAP1 [Rhizobacter sp.]|nr:urea amidolyase associated protein UAAP1 [Rhizobacter sp.]
MQISFDSLTPLARSAVPATSTRFAPELVLWEETLPGGCHWSGRVRRGNTLRLTDLSGQANVAALFYNFEDRNERYNMPDTLKAQHTALLTKGHALYSDMGRILCSIPEDSCGWHDTVCGVLDAARTRTFYGEARYQEHRNDMHRNGMDGFLVELGKWGLGKRDVVANVNFFSKASADAEGRLRFDTAHRAAGQFVDLRFEMNVLVVLSTAPHPFDPNGTYDPQPVTLTAWRSGTAGADDVCRHSCPQNDRGFINTERYFL